MRILLIFSVAILVVSGCPDLTSNLETVKNILTAANKRLSAPNECNIPARSHSFHKLGAQNATEKERELSKEILNEAKQVYNKAMKNYRQVTIPESVQKERELLDVMRNFFF